jgi:uncharacterized protein DUF3501
MNQQGASDDKARSGRAITRDSLMSLEAYARTRSDFRARVMAHKKARNVQLGNHLTLLFEDELTVRYQIQEMLRIEKMFEQAGIEDELDVYNPLIPDGSNLKATMLIEYEDENERRDALARLKGIEDRVWLRVDDLPAIHAIADEDLERANAQKTSSVHFLRFELTAPMITGFRGGENIRIGVDHPAYQVDVELPEPVRNALAVDFR